MPNPSDPVVAIETKTWWKSKILWMGVAIVLLALKDALASPDWKFDSAHMTILLRGIIGAAITLLRAAAPDVLTGIGFLDRN